MKKLAFLLITPLLFCNTGYSQNNKIIFTSDIDNFWTAYDSISSTKDYSKKIAFINNLYIDKGTKGLKAFMEVRNYNDTLWVRLIQTYPKFWNSIRSNTLSVKKKAPAIEKAIAQLKKWYPELKEAEMYFTIGGLNTACTTKNDMVLVGCELATGTVQTDVSEFRDNWRKDMFSKQSVDDIVYLNIHEYIHTQQKTGGVNRVLNQSIREGASDFISELILQEPINTEYLTYGMEHADSISELFKQEMFSEKLSNWLYNGGQKTTGADLGYYMGYVICRSYFSQFPDKSKAVKDIIELNYDNDKEVEDFLGKSRFYN